MMIQLLPEQVSRMWGILKPCIEEALPPLASNEEGRMNSILAKLLSGEMQCWAIVSDGEEKKKIEGFVVTTFSQDECSGANNLLIYALYGEGISKRNWLEGLKALILFAKRHKCEHLVAFSSNPEIIKFMERMGSDVSYTLISMPLRVKNIDRGLRRA